MFKRSTKLTSLLVVAASVASMVPAYAADYKKVDSEDGTVYNAIAYKDGQAYIDGEINDKDEAAYYVKDGKFSDLKDVDSGDEVRAYGDKYVEVGDENDGDYYLDLTSGKVTDDEIAENTIDDAASALKRKVKKDDPSRYNNADRAWDTDELTKISSNKFGETWYKVNYEADADQDVNGGATEMTVYTDNEGNYIDADYNLGKVTVITTNGSVSIKNTSDDKDGTRVAVRHLKTIGQDKDFIYRLATITVNEAGVKFGSSNNDLAPENTTDAAADVDFASGTNSSTYTVIQKISKAQDSDEVDGAKFAKTVNTYFVTDDEGKKENLYADFTINDGKVITYEVRGSKLYAKAIDLKTKNGYYYTDISDGADTDIETSTSYDYDVDGNLYALDGGYIKQFDNDEDFDKIYKVDGSFDEFNVYDKNNMVAWNEDDEVYSVIGGKAKADDTKTTTTTTTTTTTAAATGWVQNTTDGSWTYVNADGSKKVNDWVQTNGTWYFLNANGYMMANGWVLNGGSYYYLTETGAMKTGWVQLSGVWYYLAENGAMKTGWFQDATGTWYCADSNGAMLHDTTVGGYVLGSNGAWIQ